MRKIIVHCDNSKAVGCDSYEALLVEDDTSNEVIDQIAFDMACEQAGHYFDIWSVDEYEALDDDDEGNQEELPDNAILTDQIESCWEDYNPEVHDGNRTGGGSFEDDFNSMLVDMY